MEPAPASDVEIHRYLRAIEHPYFTEQEASLYEPTGYADVALTHVTVLPDSERDDIRALTPAAAHLVRLLHWMRQPLPSSRLARWDGVLADGKADGQGLASAFMEEMVAVVLANVEALIVLTTSPRILALGPLNVSPNQLPEAATAAHYRAIIEAAATFVWVASGDDQNARLNIMRLLRDQLSNATTADTSHPVNDGQLGAFIRSVERRWFYTANGATSYKKHAQKQEAPGFEKRVEGALGPDAARAWKRFSNAAHGSVAWSQVVLQYSDEHRVHGDESRPDLTPDTDRAENIGRVHHALREMFAEAVRILETDTDS